MVEMSHDCQKQPPEASYEKAVHKYFATFT